MSLTSYIPSISLSTPVSSTDSKPVSDADIAAGAPLREKARAAVLAEITYSTKLIPVLTQATVPKESIDAYSSYLTTELAWWNANVELSPRQVATRQTVYQETIQGHHDTLNQKVLAAIPTLPIATAKDILSKYPDESFVPTLQAKITGISSKASAANSAATQATLKRSTWDITKQVLSDILVHGGAILWIAVGLRCAAFAANDSMYKETPYRLLVFVYTFLLTPIVGWYYLYREVRSWIWPGTFERPIFNSVLPMFPYTMDDEGFVVGEGGARVLDGAGKERKRSYMEKWFGYLDTQEVRSWIDAKKAEELRGRMESLK